MTGRNALVVAALATVALAPATSAIAAPSTCDAYSHSCTQVEGKKITKPPAVLGTKQSLPFTGAEIVLMTVVGGGALGAGAMFVVAGRRRKASQPAA